MSEETKKRDNQTLIIHDDDEVEGTDPIQPEEG